MNTPIQFKQPHISTNLLRLVAVFAILLLVLIANNIPNADAQVYTGYKFPWTNGTTARVIRTDDGGAHSNQIDFDIGTKENEPVVAAKPGKVVLAKFSSTCTAITDSNCGIAYNNVVIIQHGPNEFSWYVHLESDWTPPVKKGDFVGYGTVIGLQGRTGNVGGTTGYHLHFMVTTNIRQNGQNINPDDLLYNPDANYSVWGDPVQVSIEDKSWSNISGTLTSHNYGSPGSCDGLNLTGVVLFEHRGCGGRGKQLSVGHTDLADFNDRASSVVIEQGWSAFAYENFNGDGAKRLIGYNLPNLENNQFLEGPGAPKQMNDAISSIDVSNTPNICSASSSSLSALEVSASDCTIPTPEPTPTSPPPGSTPPPGSSGWDVKFYSAADECNSPSCNPSTTYYQRQVDGSNINVSFADGRAYGTSPTTWGSIWKQTVYFPSGTYYFHAVHDDGVKVFIGDQNIVDVWGGPNNTTACPGRQLSGNVPITVIWKNTGGAASLAFSYDQNGAACAGGGGGQSWNVRWYNDGNECSQANCSPSTQFRQDNIGGTGISINFADGKVFGGGDDTWGSIWKTTINFPAGNYVFRLDHDDGAKLFLWDQNIQDVFGSSGYNQVCPARYLSGNVDLTVIWRNTGGPAHLTLWWDTNESVCNSSPPPQPNIWVWKDGANKTHVATDGPNNQKVRYYTSGSSEMETTPAWTSNGQGGYEFLVPDSWESFVVVGAAPTNLGAPHTDEWFLWSDGRWVGRKKLEAWVDGEEYTRLTYWNQQFATRPLLRYWVSGTETATRDLWYEISGGIEARLPRNADVIHVDAWITPRTDGYTNGYWKVDGDWLLRRTVEVYTDEIGTKVTYHYGIPGTEVLLGRYGQPLETRTDLWRTDGERLYFYLPAGVTSFLVKGGPLPLIQPWTRGVWHQPYETSHWVDESSVWIYKYQQDTLVRYMNPTEEPPALIRLYYEGDLNQHQETSLWYRVLGGWEFRVPDNAVSFLVDGGPMPIRTDPISTEWFANGYWTERRFVRIWVADWGTTYVTYWYNTSYRPAIRYWLNGQEYVTNAWELTQDGTGLQFAVPEGVQSFKVDAWIVPQLLTSTAGKWEINDRLDPWVSRVVPAPAPFTLYLPLITR